jgi:gamma-glutamylcyclotransferase (GGCT)/AIG2-like uncharacterized protein YtfP
MKKIYPINVFVYGTLRKGEPFSYLLKEAQFAGYDKVSGFIMRDLGEYPMIFEREDPRLKIIIEVYKIDYHLLQQLDNLEEYIENDENSLYIRQTVYSLSGRSGYIYYGKDENKYLSYNIIPGGDWIKK